MRPTRNGSPATNGGPDDRETGGLVDAVAATLARAILLLYPRSFRVDVGEGIVRDIRRQIRALARSRNAWAAWRRLPAIVASLLANGVGVWRERLAATGGSARRESGLTRPDSASARFSFGVSFSLLDFKLGLRMMARHPGLTLIGILGMTVAIAIGAVFASAVGIVYATLPFEGGDRLVAIENWDAEINNQEYRNLHDYLTWKAELETVEDLGAFRTARRNLIVGDGHTEAVIVAEITGAGFRLPGVPPLLGRTLVEEDMRAGAPPVLVIGYDVWRTRFASDPDIVGRTVRLGATNHTVVGIMPEGFAFPLSHGLWAPFHADPSAYERRQGPAIRIFGRLAAGATLEAAQAELGTIGQRTAELFPETHERLRPGIMPYTAQPWDDMEGFEIPFVATLIVLLLVVISANVATLIYARTATRRSELLVRTALGASRSHLVGQLFVEALVIAATAAVLGLAIAGMVMSRLNAFIEGPTLATAAFWMKFGLSAETTVWALALAVLGAVVMGVLPALEATGRRVQAGLQGFTGGSGGGMGRTWTTLIIAQVAFAVAVLPSTVFFGWEMTRYGTASPGFAADEFVTGYLYVDPGAGADAAAGFENEDFATRYANLQAELAQRMQTAVGATGVTFTSSTPGEEPVARIEVEDAASSGGAVISHAVTFNRVEPGFFDLFEITQLAGRRLAAGDATQAASAVLVNRSFVDDVLGGAAAAGRRIRYAAGYRSGGVERKPGGVDMERWYEIVGVVEDFPPRAAGPGETDAGVYHAMASGSAYPANLIMRVPRDAPANIVQRTRDVSASVDPTLRFAQLDTLDAFLRELQAGQQLAGLGFGLITLSVALLSIAGLYALMSFAVVQRHREIGIRSALGGQPRRILASIFSRVLGQVGIGTSIGMVAALAISAAIGEELGSAQGAAFLLGVPALMMAAGLVAAFAPARRGLRIEPTEALRE